MVEEIIEVKKEEEAKTMIQEAKIENERMEKNIAELKAIKTVDILSGNTNVGDPAVVKTEAQIKKEAALEFFAGTEIAKAIEKHG